MKIDFELSGYLAARMLAERLRGAATPLPPASYGPLLVDRRESTRGRGRRDPHILRAVEIIRREACDGLGAAALAARVPGSRKHFERRFREAMGHSVLAEILDVRLDLALLALQTTVSGTNTGGSALAFDVSGLVPGHPYTFRFAGIHNSTTAYGSRFRCSGLNSVQAYGLGSSAGPEIAVVPAVLPSADGTIRVEMSIGPNTADFGNGRQFLGAFSIEGDLAVSTPSATVVLFH